MIFIGYESTVRKQAYIIKKELCDRKLDIRMDDTEITGGDGIRKKITKALSSGIKCMIMVLPKNYDSKKNSGWIHFEVGYAKAKGIKIIPIIVGINKKNNKNFSPDYLNDKKCTWYEHHKEMKKLYDKLQTKYQIENTIIIFDRDFKKNRKSQKRYDYPKSKVIVVPTIYKLKEVLSDPKIKPSILLVDLFSKRTGYPSPSEAYKNPKIRKSFAKSVNEDLLEFQSHRTNIRKKVLSVWIESGIKTFEKIIEDKFLNQKLTNVPKAVFSRYGRLLLETKTTHFLTKNNIFYCWKMKDVEKSFKVCKEEFKLEFDSIMDIIAINKK